MSKNFRSGSISLLLLVIAFTRCNAFVVLHHPAALITAESRLNNVPPSLDVDAIRDAADRESPPQSFFQLQKNSIRAVQFALRDGHQLLEIEFPPLPANVLEMDDVSAYDIAEANTKLAVDFAKGYLASSAEMMDTTSNYQITILLPDEAETNIVVKNALGGLRKPAPGIQIGSLRRSEEGDTRFFKVSPESAVFFFWVVQTIFAFQKRKNKNLLIFAIPRFNLLFYFSRNKCFYRFLGVDPAGLSNLIRIPICTSFW